MKSFKHYLEYLALAIILSYFFVHNIFLVLIGITFSFYLINIYSINNFITSININIDTKKLSRKFTKNIKDTKDDSIHIQSENEEYDLTLVEAIEESGFIPSINKNNNNKVA